MSDFIKILDDMIISANGRDLTGYAFFCSKDFESDINKYNGFPVFYYNMIKEDTIYFTYDSLHYNKKRKSKIEIY